MAVSRPFPRPAEGTARSQGHGDIASHCLTGPGLADRELPDISQPEIPMIEHGTPHPRSMCSPLPCKSGDKAILAAGKPARTYVRLLEPTRSIARNLLAWTIQSAYVVSMNRIVVETGGTDWLTPLATLLAVLVGGIVSWFVESRLAGRRAQFEREEEAKAAEQLIETEARAAARVLQSDLSAAASRLESMGKRRQWLAFYSLAPVSWGIGQASLAKRLDPETWTTVAQVAMELHAIDDMMRVVIADDGPSPGASSVTINPENQKRFKLVLQDTRHAYNLLADVAKTPRV